MKIIIFILIVFVLIRVLHRSPTTSSSKTKYVCMRAYIPLRKIILCSFANDEYSHQCTEFIQRATDVYDDVVFYKTQDIAEFYNSDPVRRLIYYPDGKMTPSGYGFWIFKPYVVVDMLKKINLGDVLVYHDCAMSKYKHYSKAVTSEYLELINASLLNSDFYVQHTGSHAWTNRKFCKRDALIKMDCEHDEFLDSPQLQANFIIMRNTLEIQEAMQEWLDWCCDPDYLICYEEHDSNLRDKYPERNKSFLKEEYPEYYAHRHDQALLSNTIFRRRLPICDGDRIISWSGKNKVMCKVGNDKKGITNFVRSFLSKSITDKLHIIGVATHEDKYLENYKTSFKVNTSYHPVILGMNTKWRGFLDKFRHIQSYVQQLSADDIVCYTDTYDVLFASNLLPHIPNKLIVSSESNTMGGNISAPIPEIWKRQGDAYNKYINSGFVYGTAADISQMMKWVLEYKNNVKYENGLVYDMNKMRKTKWKDEWVPMTKEEYYKKTSMCEDDQVLLCLYANEFPERIHLDRDETYVTSIMENDNINISNLRTDFGKPCVIHVPFMKHRLHFYEQIKERILNKL